MSTSGPKIIEEIPGWRFVRWSYDSAPLTAIRIAKHSRDDAYEVEIDEAGDLTFSGVPDGCSPCLPPDGCSPCLPPEVLKRLVRDAKEREAPGWCTWSEP